MRARGYITAADSLVPNALEADIKLRWLSEAVARVEVEIHGKSAANAFKIDESGLDCDIAVIPFPYDGALTEWLCAKIAFAAGDYAAYRNGSASVNELLASYAAYFARTRLSGED